MANICSKTMKKHLLKALKKIQAEGLVEREGLNQGLCQIIWQKMEVGNYRTVLREVIKTWPLRGSHNLYPIELKELKLHPSVQFEYVLNPVYKIDFKMDYLALRWHLLHHLIMECEE